MCIFVSLIYKIANQVIMTNSSNKNIQEKTKAISLFSGAMGADTYASEFAKKHNLNLIEFLPEYDKYPPKQAPLIRNKKIVEACDCLMAFWDGKSRGTKFTLDYAKQLGKPIKIVQI